jgi:homoaconitase/3-isopropylmalate dehydratase large subunit
MGIEMGAKNTVCKPNAEVLSLVQAKAKSPNWAEVWADPDAVYARTLSYNLAELPSGTAKPYTVDNYAPIKEVLGIPIDQAFIGTCTNGRLEDLRIAAEILRGQKVKVRTIITPASCAIFETAASEGIIADLLRAGCTICHPGCGPCIGVAGGILGDNEVCVSTANRNFQGRMGSKNAKVFLTSPATAAVSALQGSISDPEDYFSGRRG